MRSDTSIVTEHARSKICDRPVVVVGAFAFIGLFFSASTRGEEELWKNCSTPTTHYVLQIPGSLVPATGPGITGCSYQSSDGEFNVEAVEQTDNQTLDARMQKEIDLLKGTVTDQKKGDNWFALTGVTSDGTEFYRLHHTNGAQWVSLRITFPRSRAKKYDKWVTRIDKEFVAFGKAAEDKAAVQNKDRQESRRPEAEKNKPSDDSTPSPEDATSSPSGRGLR